MRSDKLGDTAGDRDYETQLDKEWRDNGRQSEKDVWGHGGQKK